MRRTTEWLFRMDARSLRTVGAALAVQTLIFGLGLLVTFGQIRTELSHRVAERAREQNVRTAQGLAETLSNLGWEDTAYGSPEWAKTQRLVEHLSMLGGAFVCIVDESGRIVAHPDLRSNPGLRDVRLGGPENASITPTSPATMDPRLDPARSGVYLDGNHYLAMRYLPGGKLRLLVHQPEEGLLAIGQNDTTGLILTAALAGALLLSLTAGTSFVLIRRHNNVLETVNRGLEQQVRERVAQFLAGRHAIIIGLAKLADSRDNETGKHLDRICTYTEMLAREMAPTNPEIDETWIANLKIAAALHDIGKVGIPDSILLKQGRLNADDRRVLETHPLIGADTLIVVRKRMGDDDLLNMGIQVALSHHERWDGTGYPYGLSGEQIPLAARIVALADVYDALTSERVYKAAMSHSWAVQVLSEGRGTHFDPLVVDAFARIAGRFDETKQRLQPTAEDLTKRQAA